MLTEEQNIVQRSLTKIPLRDGVHLSAIIYTPERHAAGPCLVALTPYLCDHLHHQGMYFAARGLTFVAVDVRGRGNSEGEFRPQIQEVQDGYDVVEWVACQSYSNGQIGMYGGSYLGYAQWATAKAFPPHLATIVPTAAPYMGVDVPLRSNIFSPYYAQWLAFVSGRTAHNKFDSDVAFWSAKYRHWFVSGQPLRDVDRVFGLPSTVFQQWLSHPKQDAYWDAFNPTKQEYARLQIPILTITGAYDGDQPGALKHYCEHMRYASPTARARHFLVIGPWNHAGCAFPSANFDGLKVGPAALIDLSKLHLEWYRWTTQGGPKPGFLQDQVAYYVAGAERWRYAATLDGVTACLRPLFLRSTVNPTDVFRSGLLSSHPSGGPDHYNYDPRDISHAEVESNLDPDHLTDQSMLYALSGKQLIYHSEQFQEDTEISGFFKFVCWIAIDQPDTDFRVRIYEVNMNGGVILLTTDSLRARYRESLRDATLVHTEEPLRYEFARFTFISRLIRRNHRLRVVLGPINSVREEKNYNSGGVVAEESMKDARAVTVRLFHDEAHPSALYLPLAHNESGTSPNEE